ncbi:MAG: acetyl-CoA hydrolase, partial [Burkholderiales bacterium]
RLPDEVLALLGDRRDLRLHCGLLTEAGLTLVERGAARSVVTGAAVGDAAFYARAADAQAISYRPVSVTHDADTLAGYRRLVAVNSALEVDLFGQVNCESAGRGMVTAFGGINDFMRAAHRAPDGLSVIALAASAERGARSRIVARLSGPGLVAVQRGDVDLVATEHGIADLRGLDIDARARALIGIAAPQFRGELGAAWDEIRAGL